MNEPEGGAIGLIQAIVLGVVEGVTEFLPVSSTGHLIVSNALFGVSDPTFEIAIQAGAITAIAVLYWRELMAALRDLVHGGASDPGEGRPRVNLLWLIVVAAIPAAVVGLLFEDKIEALLFNPLTVGIALIAGGVLFLLVERWRDRRSSVDAGQEAGIADMTVRQALLVGGWQCLALVPGASRSGATIVGGLISGMSRTAAAEFSFLVGLPILYGACLLKIAGDFDRMSGPILPSLLVSSAVAFVTAFVVVRAFVRFLQRHTFRPFAYYRLAAGAAIVAMYSAGWLETSG